MMPPPSMYLMLGPYRFRILPSEAASPWSPEFLSLMEVVVVQHRKQAALHSATELMSDGEVYNRPWSRNLFWVILFASVYVRRPDHCEWVVDAFETWLRKTSVESRASDLCGMRLGGGGSANNEKNRQVFRPYYSSSDFRRLKIWLAMIPVNTRWSTTYMLSVDSDYYSRFGGTFTEAEHALFWTDFHPPANRGAITASMHFQAAVSRRLGDARVYWCLGYPLLKSLFAQYGVAGRQETFDWVSEAPQPYPVTMVPGNSAAMIQTKNGTLYVTEENRGVIQVQFLNGLHALGCTLVRNERHLATRTPPSWSKKAELLQKLLLGGASWGPPLNGAQADILRHIARGRHHLLLISGAAGTGKTTLCRRILILLCHLVYGSGGGDTALVLAPTTAALERLRTVLRNIPHIQPIFHTVDWFLTRNDTTGRIHDLKPIVLVDECGMLTGRRWVQLNATLAAKTGGVKYACFIGDDGQLPPIEWQRDLHPFAELMHSAFVRVDPGPATIRCSCLHHKKQTPCYISMCRLTDVTRSSSGIAELGASIRKGCITDTVRLLSTPSSGITWDRNGVHEQIFSGQKSSSPVLTLSHTGPCGTETLNAVLRRKHHGGSKLLWKSTLTLTPGDPVVAIENKKAYYNGQRGVVAAVGVDGVLVVCSGAEIPIVIPSTDLRLGYCCTIHSAQGAEFEDGMVIIACAPGSGHHRMLSREALYTAVTRFRSSLTLNCSLETLEKCVSTTQLCTNREQEYTGGYSVLFDDFVWTYVIVRPVSSLRSG